MTAEDFAEKPATRLRWLADRATSWAFLTGLLLPFVIFAVDQAFVVKSGLGIYSGLALLATLATTIAYWRSRARAAARAEAAGRQTFSPGPPVHA